MNVNNRIEAAQIGQELLEQKYLENVTTLRSLFVDGYAFYRFLDPTKEPLPFQESEELFVSPIILDQSIRIEGDGKTNKNDWIYLRYDSVFNPWSCYHLEVNWISGCGVVEFVQGLGTKAKVCGMTLVQLPVDQVNFIFLNQVFFFLMIFLFVSTRLKQMIHFADQFPFQLFLNMQSLLIFNSCCPNSNLFLKQEVTFTEVECFF